MFCPTTNKSTAELAADWSSWSRDLVARKLSVSLIPCALSVGLLSLLHFNLVNNGKRRYNIDVLDGGVDVSNINCGSRKRKKRKLLRETAKMKKYSTPLGSNVFVPSNHLNSKIQCKHIRPRVAKELRNKIYKDTVKLKQDVKVSHLIQISHVKRRRPRKNVVTNAG